MAFDVLPVLHGKPIWNVPPRGTDRRLYNLMGKIGKSFGLEWGGDLVDSYHEKRHFQLTEGLTFDMLKDGRTLK